MSRRRKSRSGETRRRRTGVTRGMGETRRRIETMMTTTSKTTIMKTGETTTTRTGEMTKRRREMSRRTGKNTTAMIRIQRQ